MLFIEFGALFWCIGYFSPKAFQRKAKDATLFTYEGSGRIIKSVMIVHLGMLIETYALIGAVLR